MDRERDHELGGLERDRERIRTRDLPRYSVRDLDAMRDLGDFRVIRPRDLAVSRYDGDRQAVDQLARSGYVRRYTVVDPRIKTNEPIEILTVTERGRSLLQRLDPDRTVRMMPRQGPAYGGSSRRNWIHDADVYPAVALERKRIEAEGGRVIRVIQERELAAERAHLANRSTGARGRNTPVDLKRQREIAAAMELTVVDGRVRIPDARLVYLDPDGRKRHADVEVTTPTYGAAVLSTKSKAGFHLVPGVSFTHGRAAYRER